MLAEYYLEHGDQVIGLSRGSSDLTHSSYTHETVDIGDEAAVQQFFSRLRKAQGRVDALINNAGVAASIPALLTKLGHLEATFATNVFGAFLMCREAIKMMQRQGHGRIVNFSSINVPLLSAGSVAYNASKAALENIAGTLSHEVQDADITLNTIGISLVEDTGMMNGLNADALSEKQSQLTKPDVLKIAEVAHTVDFFLSEEARNITNQTLYFGGLR